MYTWPYLQNTADCSQRADILTETKWGGQDWVVDRSPQVTTHPLCPINHVASGVLNLCPSIKFRFCKMGLVRAHLACSGEDCRWRVGFQPSVSPEAPLSPWASAKGWVGDVWGWGSFVEGQKSISVHFWSMVNISFLKTAVSFFFFFFPQ